MQCHKHFYIAKKGISYYCLAFLISGCGVNSTTPSTVSALNDTQVTSAAIYACGIKQGIGYCWGKNSVGELGNGTTNDTNTPVAIATGESSAIPVDAYLVSISTGTAYDGQGASCAVDRIGNAYCWGDGEAGNFGNGTNSVTSAYPVKVVKGGFSAIPLNSKLIKIGTTNNSSCAIDDSGNAYCWGDNTQGQLGNGTSQNESYAVLVSKGGQSAIPVGDRITDISVGSLYTCALDQYGKAFCWGYSSAGQCGSGDYEDNLYPTAVATNPSTESSSLSASAIVTQISASANTTCPTNELNTCAIDSNGDGYCWGSNNAGQLGINSLLIQNSPYPLSVLAGISPSAIPASAKFSKISAGSGVSCAIADGLGYCWGNNSYGELGNNTTISSSYPVAISTTGAITESTVLRDISVADYGIDDSINNGLGCAVDIGNNFYCWGNNTYGQLGNGVTGVDSSAPVKVLFP